MRRMSFSKTIRAYCDHTKTVTRRASWWDVKVGEILIGAEKTMGLRRGEKMIVLGQHRVLSVRRERLDAVTAQDVIQEGFPNMSRDEFIEMFCRCMKCTPETIINRIEFEYVE